jgi:uncharacterized protein YjbI with pentapeptide repeats
MEIAENWSLAQLQEAYASGKRNFSNIDFSQSDYPHVFKQLVLEDANFKACWLSNLVFDECRMQRVRFDSCNLKCTTFLGCDFTRSVWNECAVCAIEGKNSQLEGIDVFNLDAYGHSFESEQEFIEYAIRL